MPRQQQLEFPTFCPIVCERIRRLTAQRLKLEGKRAKLFKDRDAAAKELEDLPAKDLKGRERLYAEWGMCELSIKSLTHEIREVQTSLDATVLNADQAELFPDPDTFDDPEKEKVEDPEVEG